MIYGIGTDIVSLKRIIRLSKKFGQAFAERILTPEELLEFPQAGKPVNYLAKRFHSTYFANPELVERRNLLHLCVSGCGEGVKGGLLRFNGA